MAQASPGFFGGYGIPRMRGPYLEGHGDVVSGLRLGVTWVIIWIVGVINLLTKSP